MSSAVTVPDIRTLIAPTGFKVLVQVATQEEKQEKKTDAGLYVPSQTASDEALATMTGQVLALGPDAYSDPKRFPSGPWCKEGDTVVFRAFAGIKLRLRGRDYRLINDDTVEAVTAVPDEIRRS